MENRPTQPRLEAARALVRANIGKGADHDALFGHEGLQDAWFGRGQEFQVPLQEALETLFLEGRPDEAELAVGFWSSVHPRPAFCKQLVRAFLAAPNPYLALLLGHNRRVVLDGDDIRVLTALCQARAPHSEALLHNLLINDPDGPAWRSLVERTREATSLGELAGLYDAAFAAGRTAAWLPELRGLPGDLVRALEPVLLPDDLRGLQQQQGKARGT